MRDRGNSFSLPVHGYGERLFQWDHHIKLMDLKYVHIYVQFFFKTDFAKKKEKEKERKSCRK